MRVAWLALGVLLFSRSASAQTPPPPSTLEKAADAIASLVRPYGTLKPTVEFSVGTVESFSQPNSTAMTAAGNPLLATLPKDTRLSFQMGQSRLGMWVAEKAVARAHVEVDFVDFTKSSPTVASVPRLRIAIVEWEPKENLVFGLGQDWDIYGPLNPFGTNLVGASFLAGNTGFIRQIIRGMYTSRHFEVGGEVGLQGPNNTFRDAGPELARVPSFAVRGGYISGKSKVGISALATQLRFAPGAPTERRAGAYGVLGYLDLFVRDSFELRGEAYVGRNMSNTGALALGFGSAAHDIQEAGGFVSARQQLTERNAVYLTAGLAQILNAGNVAPSYTITPAAGTTPATRALGTTGPGMKVNMAGRVGYEYRPVKALAFLIEGFVFRSRHVFQAADWGLEATEHLEPMRSVPGIETGATYTF